MEKLRAANYPAVRFLEYGAALKGDVSNSRKGVTLYPVKVSHKYFNGYLESRDEQHDVFYFYKDEFGDWRWFRKR